MYLLPAGLPPRTQGGGMGGGGMERSFGGANRSSSTILFSFNIFASDYRKPSFNKCVSDTPVALRNL